MSAVSCYGGAHILLSCYLPASKTLDSCLGSSLLHRGFEFRSASLAYSRSLVKHPNFLQ